MTERKPDASSHATCDYANLPHSGGGTNHGPATHNKGGYHICDKCYDAIIQAEGREEAAYARASSQPHARYSYNDLLRCVREQQAALDECVTWIENCDAESSGSHVIGNAEAVLARWRIE